MVWEKKKQQGQKKKNISSRQCMRYGTIKHEWIQHRLLCSGSKECIHNKDYIKMDFPHLVENLKFLKHAIEHDMKAEVVGSEIPVEIDIGGSNSNSNSKRSRRADLLLQYTSGLHKGEFAMVEFKFFSSGLFQSSKSKRTQYKKEKTMSQYKTQARRYLRLWNKSPNVKYGKCTTAFLVFMEVYDPQPPRVKIMNVTLTTRK
jgi:hypothetical protein